jgi:hypothetical protein
MLPLKVSVTVRYLIFVNFVASTPRCVSKKINDDPGPKNLSVKCGNDNNIEFCSLFKLHS